MSSAGQQFQFPALTNAECYVDIYPYEGGSYTLSGGNILALTTEKNIKENVGTFSILLAPDFVAPNSYVEWPQVLTPMSLVVIGMRHGGIQTVTMVGFVTTAGENQVWLTGQSVKRGFVVQGVDLGYFFTMADYFSLWFLSVVGQNQGLANAGFSYGDPGQVGQTWFQTIMGKSGVFAGTFVNYGSNTVSFANLFSTLFQNYDVTIPYGDFFLGENAAWIDKFRLIYPFPFYEFFIATDPGSQNYPGVGSGGQQFQSKTLGTNAQSTVDVIARINPLPRLTATTNGTIPNYTGIDTSLWNQLPKFDPKGLGFIESHPMFSEAEVANAYCINPTWMQGLVGNSANNITPTIFTYSISVDFASINRYGYRPMIVNLPWLSDWNAQYAQAKGGNSQQSMAQLYATLYARLCGYYEASPLMCRSRVAYPLRPDIVPGTRFTYVPFPDNQTWDFYIEGVSHSYVFGGQCTTELVLTRGLPSSIYADSSSNGILFNIHIGAAERVNGVYQSGLRGGSAAGLTALNPIAFAQWIGTLAQLYTTAQAVSGH